MCRRSIAKFRTREASSTGWLKPARLGTCKLLSYTETVRYTKRAAAINVHVRARLKRPTDCRRRLTDSHNMPHPSPAVLQIASPAPPLNCQSFILQIRPRATLMICAAHDSADTKTCILTAI